MVWVIVRLRGSPPAKANRYRWTNRGTPRLVKERGVTDYEHSAALQMQALRSQIGVSYTGRTRLIIRYYQPTRRRRDIDNIVKPIADAITQAGLWQDDSQIDSLMVERIAPSSKAAGEWTELIIGPYDTNHGCVPLHLPLVYEADWSGL